MRESQLLVRAATGSEDGVAVIRVFDQLIGIKLEEPLLNVPHVLSKSEAREKAVGRGWSIPKYDSIPSGQLAIVLDHRADGERRTFSSTAERMIDSVLADVMKGLVKIAMRLRADEKRRAERERRDREAAELRRQEEQRRRDEVARIAEERRRRRELLRQSTRLRRAEYLDHLIRSVEATVNSTNLENARSAEWLTFARAVVQELTPIPELLETFRDRSEES
jgi:hypothetical protein